jgi:hypothetical protein
VRGANQARLSSCESRNLLTQPISGGRTNGKRQQQPEKRSQEAEEGQSRKEVVVCVFGFSRPLITSAAVFFSAFGL